MIHKFINLWYIMKYKIIAVVSIFLLWIFFIWYWATHKINKYKWYNPTNQQDTQTWNDYSCIKNPKIYTYMYHYIRPDNWEQKSWTIYKNSVLPQEFDKHMQILNKLQKEWKIYIAFLWELQQFQTQRCFPNKNIVVMTADDWWYDNYANLFPTIKKYNIKFNLWLIYNNIGKWNTHIGPFMSENEIKTMFKSGLINISSHSLSHQDFRSLDNSQTENEMCDSKSKLEQMFSIRINSFIYPAWQIWWHSSTELIRKCWYYYGIWTKYGIMDLEHLKANYFNLKRIRVSRSSDTNKLFNFK